MSHPECCKNPDTCTLSYIDHLKGIRISADATPSVKPETHASNVREARWHRDHAAFKRLYQQGYHPPKLDGSALREQQATNRFDIEHRPVDIDYSTAKLD